MRKLRSAVSLLLCLIFACSLTFGVSADNGNVTYEKNARKFIFAPGSDYSETDLFPDLKEVMPGDKRDQIITVKNNANWKIKVKIYLRSFGATEESKEFLSKLNLKVEKTDGTLLFDAPADQTDDLTKWTYIGLLYSGGKTDIKVTLEVPKDLDDEDQLKIGHIMWQFKVEEYPIEQGDPRPPQTGDTSNILPWIIGAGVSLLVLIFVIIFLARKKKEEE